VRRGLIEFDGKGKEGKERVNDRIPFDASPDADVDSPFLGDKAAKSLEISPSSSPSSSAHDFEGWKGVAVGLSPDMVYRFLRGLGAYIFRQSIEQAIMTRQTRLRRYVYCYV
jgi:hypothetical protein